MWLDGQRILMFGFEKIGREGEWAKGLICVKRDSRVLELFCR
jgi:hypothetical protein